MLSNEEFDALAIEVANKVSTQYDMHSNEGISAFARLFLAELTKRTKPVALIHVIETDTYLDASVEVKMGEFLQPKDSPIAVFLHPPAPQQVPEGMTIAPDFRGYANLGTGCYNLDVSGDAPELIISIATDDEKAGREVGDLKDNPPGTVITADVMAVRLAFASERGLFALEQQLQLLREAHFPAAPKAQP